MLLRVTDIGHLKESKIIFYSNLLESIWGVERLMTVKGTKYEFQLGIIGRVAQPHTSPGWYQSLPTDRVKGS